MAKVILAVEVSDAKWSFLDTDGEVLGYLEPFSGQPLEGDKLYRLVEETDEMSAT